MKNGLPIRERLRWYINDKPYTNLFIDQVAAHFGCPINSMYIPIRELENEGLVKFRRGSKQFITLPIQGSIYWYQPLFDLMCKEHNKALLKSEMDDIITAVQKMLNTGQNPERSVATSAKSGNKS